MILTQGLSLNQMTSIVGVFLHDKTSASKIFARKCEILNSSRACDAKFKKTMFNNTARENH